MMEITLTSLCITMLTWIYCCGVNAELYMPLPLDLCPYVNQNSAKYRPNVCAVEEVMDTRKRYYTECMQFTPREICHKPTFIRYQCCTGFERAEEKAKTCRGVVPMENMWEKCKHLFLRELRKHAKKAGMQPRLEEKGPQTLFAPYNQAFVGIDRNTRRALSSSPSPEASLLLYHMVGDRVYSQDLTNGQQIDTMYGEEGNKEKLYINRYSNGITTINCARLILSNEPATNGLVSVIEKIVHPVPRNQQDLPMTVMELLMDTSREFGEFVQALILARMVNDLRSPGSFTILAPTDAVFRNAPQEVIQRILNDNDLLRRVLDYHITEQSICSSAIIAPTNLTSREGQKLHFDCDINDRLLVNGFPTTDTDLVASNGVIHTINTLLLPNSAKTPEDVLTELGSTRYLSYMRSTGMTEVLQSGRENITFFVPSDEAFAALSREDQMRLRDDPDYQIRVMQHHMVSSRVPSRQFISQPSLVTAAGDPDDKLVITVKKQRGFDISGAHLVSRDHFAGNGVIHLIDQVLIPAESEAIALLAEDPRLSMFQELVLLYQKEHPLLPGGDGYTVFAPTIQALEDLKSTFLEKLLLDATIRNKFLKYHILPTVFYTTSVEHDLRYRYQTLSGEWLHLGRREADKGDDLDDTGRRGDRDRTNQPGLDTNTNRPILLNKVAKILTADIKATNGVIHVIDKALISPALQSLANEV